MTAVVANDFVTHLPLRSSTTHASSPPLKSPFSIHHESLSEDTRSALPESRQSDPRVHCDTGMAKLKREWQAQERPNIAYTSHTQHAKTISQGTALNAFATDRAAGVFLLLAQTLACPWHYLQLLSHAARAVHRDTLDLLMTIKLSKLNHCS